MNLFACATWVTGGEEQCGGNDPGAGNSQQFPSRWLRGLGMAPSWTAQGINLGNHDATSISSIDLLVDLQHGSAWLERFNSCPQGLMRFCQRLGLLGPDFVAVLRGD